MTGTASVDVYMWKIDRSAVDAAHIRTFLSTDEKARADRFFRPIDRYRWAASRAGLRQLLSRELGIAPDAIVFGQEANGRPNLVGIEAVSFNLSHSADVAALAISRDTRVGVDVEDIREIRSDEIERALSIAERLELAEAADALQLETFFRFWTLKEAFMKGTGLGASLPLHDFDVSPAGPGLLRLKDAPAEPGRWRFDEFVPKPGVRAALAARTDDRDLVVQWRWADFE